MNERQHMVGATVVYVDSHGNPYRFERHGAKVDCICDPVHNLICHWHAQKLPDPEMALRSQAVGVPLDGPQVCQEVP